MQIHGTVPVITPKDQMTKIFCWVDTCCLFDVSMQDDRQDVLLGWAFSSIRRWVVQYVAVVVSLKTNECQSFQPQLYCTFVDLRLDSEGPTVTSDHAGDFEVILQMSRGSRERCQMMWKRYNYSLLLQYNTYEREVTEVPVSVKLLDFSIY